MQYATTKNSLNHADYAGFWIRFFAVLIDMALYAPLHYTFSALIGEAHPFITEGVFAGFALITYALFFASQMAGSPGMYLLRFHICDTQGKRITFKHAFTWCITSALGCAFCLGGVIYLQYHFDLSTISELNKSCVEQNIAPEDCTKEIESIIHIPFASFQQLCFAALVMTAFLSIIWVLSIALPKDKTGFHNLICGTRFVKGRLKKSD